MELEAGTHDDDGTTRIIDAFTEQVLTEATMFALETVGQGLKRTLVGTGDCFPATTVVKQCIDRLLKHAALVANDDLRRIKFDEALQTIVAVNDATIQVIEIRSRKTTAIQSNQWAQ